MKSLKNVSERNKKLNNENKKHREENQKPKRRMDDIEDATKVLKKQIVTDRVNKVLKKNNGNEMQKKLGEYVKAAREEEI